MPKDIQLPNERGVDPRLPNRGKAELDRLRHAGKKMRSILDKKELIKKALGN